MTVHFPEYTVWYLPDSPEGLLSEPLSRVFTEDDFPPYSLGEGEKIDFILSETYERGEPLEIRVRNTPSTYLERVWNNRSWGID